jgi:hypothetical protein
MRKALLSICSTAAMAAGLLSATAPASAATTMTNVIKNHADDCGGGNHWANDTFTRTTVINRVTDNPGPNDVYKVTIKDDGTFTGIAGGPSLFDVNVHLLRAIPGTIKGGATFTITGALKSYNIDGDVYDDGNAQLTNCASSWPTKLFKSGYAGGIDDWGWTYQTSDETMVNAAAGSSGNIIGKIASVLTAKTDCRLGVKVKTNRWTVSNVKGPRSRNFSFWLRYTDGTYSKTGYGSVAAGGTTRVYTPAGGRLTVKFYDGYGVEKRVYAFSNYGTTHKVCFESLA